MFRRAAVGASLVLAAAGCGRPDAFVCHAATDCDETAGGRCEPAGFCSYPDSECQSLHRYGASAGTNANECVPYPLCGWSARRRLVFDNAQSDDLLDIPVLVRLDSTRIDYTRTQAGGADLRFMASDGTLLAYEIERWNDAGSSYVWVRVPRIQAASTTDFMWMAYGNPAVADAQQAALVWSNGFVGVWHLSEDPSQPAPQLEDSTANANHGTSTGAMTSADQVPAQVAGGLDLDSLDDSVKIGDVPTFDGLGPVTFSVWLNARSIPNAAETLLIHKGGTSTAPDEDSITLRLLGTWRVLFAVTYATSDLLKRTAINQVTPNTWQHVVATWTGSPDAAEAAVYVNANLPVFDQATDGTGARRSDTGRDLTLGSKSSLDGGHDGVLDEIRISSVARSPDWIRAEYKSETDDLITFEPEQPIACSDLDR